MVASVPWCSSSLPHFCLVRSYQRRANPLSLLPLEGPAGLADGCKTQDGSLLDQNRLLAGRLASKGREALVCLSVSAVIHKTSTPLPQSVCLIVALVLVDGAVHSKLVQALQVFLYQHLSVFLCVLLVPGIYSILNTKK